MIAFKVKLIIFLIDKVLFYTINLTNLSENFLFALFI